MYIIILFIVLLILVLYVQENFENQVINQIQPRYYNFYQSKFTNKDKYENILLVGFIEEKTLQYFGTNFPNCKIYLINEDKIIYKNSLASNIEIINNFPYDMNLINYFTNNNLMFDLILIEGLVVTDNIKFAFKNYVNLLTNIGIFIVENLQNYNDVSQIISSLPMEIKNRIDIIDYRKVYNKYDDILICLDKNF